MKPEILKKLSLFALLLPLFGCQKIESSGGVYRVRIPVDNGHGSYVMETKELKSVTDLSSMTGTSAVFKTDGHFNFKIDSSGNGTVDEKNLGNTPQAQFVRSGEVYYPADFNSLSMTAAMYHFESIRNFYDSIGANKDLQFPRIVLLNLNETYRMGDEQMSSSNNAAYVPQFDIFFINPYRRPDIPLQMNGGVLAHEYLHSIFLKKLQQKLSHSIDRNLVSQVDSERKFKVLESSSSFYDWEIRSGISSQQLVPSSPVDEAALSAKETEAANTLIFASINEGIADYFGYEYSGNPGWILPSLPTQKFRDLSENKEFPLTSGDQERLIRKSIATSNPDMKIDEHDLGAYFSHFLYTVASVEGGWGHEKTKLKTLEFMDRYASLISTNMSSKFMSIGELVRLFFASEWPSVSLCKEVIRIFSGELNYSNFSCGTSPTAADTNDTSESALL